MNMQVSIYEGNGGSCDYLLDDFHKDAIGFGRENDCDIVMHSPYVSRLHGCIYKENGNWYVKDLDSSFGLSFNGKKINDMRISGGEHIKIINNSGDYCELVFREISNAGVPNNLSGYYQQPVYQTSSYQQQPYPAPEYGNPYGQQLGMKWYKFIIWFQLFAFFAVCLYYGFWGVQMIAVESQIRSAYDEQFGDYGSIMYELGNETGFNNYIVSQEEIRELKIMGSIIVIFAALFGFCALYIRQNLAKFKKGAPRDYLVFIGFFAAVFIILQLVMLANYFERGRIDSGVGFLIFEFIGTIVYVYANNVYFKNRSHLFVN